MSAVLEGTSMDPTTHEHQMVLVTNEGDRPLSLMFHGNPYVLQPNETQPVPYLAMVLWFGNPRAVDMSRDDPTRKYRTKECERLSSKYGMGFDAWYSDPDLLTPGEKPRTTSHIPGMDPTFDYTLDTVLGRVKYRNPRLPRVKCETWDHQRIVTVIDDPEGHYVAPGADDAQKNQIEQIMAQLEASRQNQMLMLQVLQDQNPDLANQMRANLSTHVDTLQSDSGVPLWPSPGTEHPVSQPVPITTPADATSVLGDDSGLTGALEADPTPRPRTQPRTKPASK